MAISNILRTIEYISSSGPGTETVEHTRIYDDVTQDIIGGEPVGWTNGNQPDDSFHEVEGPNVRFWGGYHTAVDYTRRKMYVYTLNFVENRKTTTEFGFTVIDLDEGGMDFQTLTYDRTVIAASTYRELDSPNALEGTNYIVACAEYSDRWTDYLLINTSTMAITDKAASQHPSIGANPRYPSWTLACESGGITKYFGVYPSGDDTSAGGTTADLNRITIVEYDLALGAVNIVVENQDITSGTTGRHYDIPNVRQGRTSATEDGICSFFMSDKTTGAFYEFTIPFDISSWSDVTITEAYKDEDLAFGTGKWANSWSSVRLGINSFHYEESQNTLVFWYADSTDPEADEDTFTNSGFFRNVNLTDGSILWQTDTILGDNWFLNLRDHHYRYVPCTVGCRFVDPEDGKNKVRIINLENGESYIVQEDFSAPIFTPASPADSSSFFDGQEDTLYYVNSGNEVATVYDDPGNNWVTQVSRTLNDVEKNFAGSFAYTLKANIFFSNQIVCASSLTGVSFGEEKDPLFVDFGSI